jgi:hypothetical protein
MTQSIHISTSGGLISAAFIENIHELGARQRGVEPESFNLPWSQAPKSPAALEETIATAWELLKERWDAVRADLPMMDLSQVRARWLLPLFQLLDFDPVYLRSDTVLDETGDLRFPLSHRGWQGEDAPILHTVAPSQSLDSRTGSGRGVKTKSPHDMLQAFLNASRADHWALLTNGIALRLLRDYHHTFTKGYVEFDLESIFETRNYGDFRALYRMCHASRFIAPPLPGERGLGGEGEIPPLEQFYKDSLATGIKVGEDLRGQVRQAIETLGNGFLAGGVIRSPAGHPSVGASGLDGELIRQLQADPDLCRRYYAEILHIVYRILFLLFAEQRGMLPHTGAPLEDLYRSQYSITALRTRAEGDIPREEGFTDLWEGLQVTFRMLREGAPQLGVFGYDGMLFADGQTPLLDGLPSSSQGEGTGMGIRRACRNSDLLYAIRALTLIEREGVLQRISYADLGVEELGSIYESLLDFNPRVSTAPEDVDASASLSTGGRPVPANTFFLDPRGAERKTTGSYYTHPSLVNELIKSALLPVARDRLARAGLPVVDEEAVGEATAGLLTDYAGLSDAQRAAGEAALLSLRICDPAAGSGHFLVKADNTLGAELARIRSGDDYPAEEGVQAARRDMLAHCLYAVDLNPMAVELCKVSLWINASVRDKPLSFLDHHIKCGNSLIGATPELMEDGIPTDAFQAVTGDHKPTVNAIRKRNREEQAGQLPLGLQVTLIETPEDLARWRRLTLLAEEQPQAAREAYGRYTADPDYQRKKLEADFWTAAFFWPLPEGTDWAPTHGEFRRLQAEGLEALDPRLAEQIEELAERYRFFHWHLEFPDVFSDDGGGGFDVVLGNPPWETLEFKEKEFFADRAPEIANASTAAKRSQMIQGLPERNLALYQAYQHALRDNECLTSYLRGSERYPLVAQGRINTYQIFAGLARQTMSQYGRVGMVIPSGIVTDYYNQDYFGSIVENRELSNLYDFENREGIFPGVHRSYKFSLMTLTGQEVPASEIDFAFYLGRVDQLADEERHFNLAREDLRRINPNTVTCPTFRSRRDAELTRKIYRLTPAMVIENENQNAWQAVFKQGLFNISSASGYFRDQVYLTESGLKLAGNQYVSADSNGYLPVYEDWMIFQFDHRYNSHRADYTTELEHRNPSFLPMPRYWIERSKAQEEAASFPQKEWFVVFRDRARTTDSRTTIFAVVPLSGITHPLPIIGSPLFNTPLVCVALANFNAFVFDYIARQKLSSYHLTFYVVKQQSTVPPDRYTPDLLAFIVPRVLELTCTAWDIKAFADDVWREADTTLQTAIMQAWEANVATTGGHVGAQPPAWVNLPSSNLPWPTRQGRQSPFPHPPFKWDEERRAHLRAELDALYGHLYGLTREELDYILDTFPIVRRKDEERWGEYRTKRLVLEYYERLEPLKH